MKIVNHKLRYTQEQIDILFRDVKKVLMETFKIGILDPLEEPTELCVIEGKKQILVPTVIDIEKLDATLIATKIASISVKYKDSSDQVQTRKAKYVAFRHFTPARLNHDNFQPIGYDTLSVAVI